MSSEQYYNDPSQWGSYQYVTLKEVLNNFMMSRDPDYYTSNTVRYKLLYHAKRGLREFYFDVLKEVRAISLELSPNLNVILPPDYINYVRISWVDDEGQLHPMAEDRRMSIAQEYLQDNNFRLLFDSNGCVLKGDTMQPMDDQTFDPQNNQGADSEFTNHCYNFHPAYRPNLDASRVFQNGKYRINKTDGVIEFGSDISGKTIVLEYISDGLFSGCEGVPEEEIKIHKFAESALIDYIYYQSIKMRRHVPAYEKRRARKEFYNSKRVAKRRLNTLRKDELLKIFDGSSKQIK